VATTRTATAPDGHDLRARASGAPDGSPVQLVVGAASSSAVRLPPLLERLGDRHRVLVWDHRGTDRSGRWRSGWVLTAGASTPWTDPAGD